MNAAHPEYPCFAALIAARQEGRDYDRVIQFQRHAQVAILAPHGGRIEPGTGRIATEIAGDEFSLYCFRSRMPSREANLHITSHNFDDPDCIGPLSRHRHVVKVHGCKADGELVLLGRVQKDQETACTSKVSGPRNRQNMDRARKATWVVCTGN